MQAPTIPTIPQDAPSIGAPLPLPAPPSAAGPLGLLETDGRHVFFDTIVFDVDDWEADRV